MTDNSTFKVLESRWTVSGKMLVALQSFDRMVPIGCRLTSHTGTSWIVTQREAQIGRPSDKELQQKAQELGAVLFTLSPKVITSGRKMVSN